jgi:hypothetical protein
MAADTKARLSLSVYDAVGGRGTLLQHAFIDSASTVAEAITALATMKTNYLTLGGAGISEGQLSIVDTALAVAPVAGANVSLVGNMGFVTAASPSRFGISVPSFLESLINADGTISMTSGAAAAWAAYIIAGTLGGNFTNLAYVDLTAVKNAFRSGRKLRR